MPRLYFDYNATTPIHDQVFEVMERVLKVHFGNPSSAHQEGQAALRILRDARLKMAAFLGASSENQVVFTSGGTESNNAAIRSALRNFPDKKHVITSQVEHSSVRNIFKALEKEGCRVTWVGVDAEGRLSLDQLKSALSQETALVSLMMANNETGVLFPIEEAAAMIQASGALFHVDAVQAAGKIPLDLKKIAVDFVSISAHKFYGPKGAGALYVRNPSIFAPLIIGGSQERGRRGGTENVAGIAGMALAAELAAASIELEMKRQEKLRDFFETQIISSWPQTAVHGKSTVRLPNTSSLRFPGVSGEALLCALDENGISASSGSACLSGAREPSHVLKAMGVSDEEALSAIRFSFGSGTTHDDILKLKDILLERLSVLGGISSSKSPSFQEAS